MIEVLQFTFDSFGHFCGICFLISLCGFWVNVISVQLSKIGRPRKHIKTTYTNTHKL